MIIENGKRINGIVKAAKQKNGTVQYAYITDGKKDYPVTTITIQRTANAVEVLVPGKKVTFTVYHGKKDYANDILPVVESTADSKPNMMDISMLSVEAQELVENFKGRVDLRRSILTTMFQPKYMELSKDDYIEAYLTTLKHRLIDADAIRKPVTELIEYYWRIKKGN